VRRDAKLKRSSVCDAPHTRQLERALIAERTKAGLLAARKRGRVGGNPGLRARDPAAIRKIQASRDATWLDRVLAQLDTWLPTVRRMRPAAGRHTLASLLR
jgi:DNA invertase Pin-like site-specific DNA recombinase